MTLTPANRSTMKAGTTEFLDIQGGPVAYGTSAAGSLELLAANPSVSEVVTIPLAPRTTRAIDLAIGERTDGPVFLTAAGVRLGRHGAARIVRRAAGRAGIVKRIGPLSRPGLGSGIAPGPFPRAARRTRRTDLSVTGSLRLLPSCGVRGRPGGWDLVAR